jgi:CRISPR-associated exonuclease Cas4
MNYYFVCIRKLWLFSRDIELENESDLVKLGNLLHKEQYKKKNKEIQIGGVKLDFVENNSEIHEIKRSRKLEVAHTYQLLYYLFLMKKNFGLSMKGSLDYPLLRKKIIVNLTQEREIELSKIINDIREIIEKQKPPEPIWKNYCKSCAYRDLCWS